MPWTSITDNNAEQVPTTKGVTMEDELCEGELWAGQYAEEAEREAYADFGMSWVGGGGNAADVAAAWRHLDHD
jgi:hypothetical protein